MRFATVVLLAAVASPLCCSAAPVAMETGEVVAEIVSTTSSAAAAAAAAAANGAASTANSVVHIASEFADSATSSNRGLIRRPVAALGRAVRSTWDYTRGGLRKVSSGVNAGWHKTKDFAVAHRNVALGAGIIGGAAVGGAYLAHNFWAPPTKTTVQADKSCELWFRKGCSTKEGGPKDDDEEDSAVPEHVAKAIAAAYRQGALDAVNAVKEGHVVATTHSTTLSSSNAPIAKKNDEQKDERD